MDADLRAFNERCFAQFDARVEQRLSELNARLERLELALEQSFGGLHSDLCTELAQQRSELIKWMFIYWAGTVVPLAGLILALHKS